VAGAKVTATEVRTQQKLTATTGEQGAYALIGLRVGAYSVTIEAPGFSRFVQDGVVIDAALRSTVDATLTVGSVNEVINVAAETTGPGLFALLPAVR